MTGRTVLVVDDDDDVREITSCALELLAGWTVIEATGGAPALELAAEHQPDLILLDVMMPDMDGPTTVRALHGRPHTRAIPVILLTAKAQFAAGLAEADLDVVGVITKPFDPHGLVDTIDRLLAEHDRRPSRLTA